MYSEALVPQLVLKSENKVLTNLLSILGGVLLLAALAQVIIPLPWTPVPITGQTFAVALISLMFGAKRGGVILALYISIGALGAPVFASAGSGLTVGPTLGYLVGMWLASFVVGHLADCGFAKSFGKALLAAYAGSAIIFTCGVIGLSFFIPTEALFITGVAPFLLGDLIKNSLAAALSQKVGRTFS